jgi:effector-binding domain-containing protein
MFTEPKIDERSEQPYMGIRVQVPMSQMPDTIGRTFDEVFAWVAGKGIVPAGAPFVRYHVIDMAANLDIEMGVPVEKHVPGDDRVKAGLLPAGRYASLVFTGIRNGYEGNSKLIGWAQEQGIRWDRWDDPKGDAFRSRYETTFTDPDEEPNMDIWETEVAIKLADE